MAYFLSPVMFEGYARHLEGYVQVHSLLTVTKIEN